MDTGGWGAWRGGAALEWSLRHGARGTLLWIFGIVGFYMLMYALSTLGALPDSVTFGVAW